MKKGIESEFHLQNIQEYFCQIIPSRLQIDCFFVCVWIICGLMTIILLVITCYGKISAHLNE